MLSEVRNARLAEALEALNDLAPTLRARELRALQALTTAFAGKVATEAIEEEQPEWGEVREQATELIHRAKETGGNGN